MLNKFLFCELPVVKYAKLFLQQWRHEYKLTTRMWANAQRDGHPAEYRWRPLFNAAKFDWCPLPECRAVTLPKGAKTRNPLKLAGMPQTNKQISAASGLKFTIL